LLGGSLAASAALLLTLLLVVRPLEPARFRLLPGWESGSTQGVAALGLLALGQALDSMTVLARVEEHGALEVIRRVLTTTSGPDLFGAVVVLGVVAGGAEEIFFRGYMQSRLREHWRPATAVLATSAAFGVLHLPLSSLHTLLAFALGLYLGFVAEMTGSVLPCIVCHVVNNTVYTLQTALGVNVVGREANLAAVMLSAAVFLGCVLWIRRAAPPLGA
jgi:hypothetical protein